MRWAKFCNRGVGIFCCSYDKLNETGVAGEKHASDLAESLYRPKPTSANVGLVRQFADGFVDPP